MSGYFYNEARSKLDQLTVDDLKNLMNNEDALNQFVRKLSEVQQIEATKKSLEESNRKLAAENLEREPIFRREKEKLIDLHKQIAEKNEEYRRLCNADGSSSNEETNETNPEFVLAMLQSSSAELERQSEQMAEDFFYGRKMEDEVTEFERRFIEDRKRAHELKIKAEKFHELYHMSTATSYLNSNHRYRPPHSYR